MKTPKCNIFIFLTFANKKYCAIKTSLLSRIAVEWLSPNIFTPVQSHVMEVARQRSLVSSNYKINMKHRYTSFQLFSHMHTHDNVTFRCRNTKQLLAFLCFYPWKKYTDSSFSHLETFESRIHFCGSLKHIFFTLQFNFHICCSRIILSTVLMFSLEKTIMFKLITWFYNIKSVKIQGQIWFHLAQKTKELFTIIHLTSEEFLKGEVHLRKIFLWRGCSVMITVTVSFSNAH